MKAWHLRQTECTRTHTHTHLHTHTHMRGTVWTKQILGLHESTVKTADLLHTRRLTCEGKRLATGVHHAAHFRTQALGKLPVTRVVGRHGHDCATAIASQHVVSHPNLHYKTFNLSSLCIHHQSIHPLTHPHTHTHTYPSVHQPSIQPPTQPTIYSYVIIHPSIHIP